MCMDTWLSLVHLMRVIKCFSMKVPWIHPVVFQVLQQTGPCASSARLTCPAESKQQNAGVGYSTLAEDLKHIQEIGGLPNSFKLTQSP